MPISTALFSPATTTPLFPEATEVDRSACKLLVPQRSSPPTRSRAVEAFRNSTHKEKCMPVPLIDDIFTIDDGISHRQCNLFRSDPAAVIGCRKQTSGLLVRCCSIIHSVGRPCSSFAIELPFDLQ